MAPLSDPINPTIWGDTRGTVQCCHPERESEEKGRRNVEGQAQPGEQGRNVEGQAPPGP